MATRKQEWLTAEQQRAWIAFMRVQLRMSYEMNRQLQADSGLSLADYDVLVALSDNQSMRVSDLAARIGWERSRLSHQLRRMEERGLTVRRPSADDGRTSHVELTKGGKQAITDAAPGHVDLVRRLFFEPLPDNLLAPLTAALEHIHVNLNLNSSLPPAPG